MSEAQYCQACAGDPRRRANQEPHKRHELESPGTLPGNPSRPPLPDNSGDTAWLEA